MFNIKGQDGGIYSVSKIYPKQYSTYTKTYHFVMGDDHILGIFRSEKNCNRVLRNFLTWHSSESSNTTVFTIAQDDSTISYSVSNSDQNTEDAEKEIEN